MNPNEEPAGIEEELCAFRDSVRAGSDRPEEFWNRQRSAVHAKLERKRPVTWRRPALVWSTLAMAVGACLFLFVTSDSAPRPDFAAGSDQDLLIDVEHAVDQEYPSAFDPAALFTEEIEQNARKE